MIYATNQSCFFKMLGSVTIKRALLRRFRKEKTRTVPSPSSIFGYLEKFHTKKQVGLRKPGRAFIPAPNEHLQGFVGVNRDGENAAWWWIMILAFNLNAIMKKMAMGKKGDSNASAGSIRIDKYDRQKRLLGHLRGPVRPKTSIYQYFR